MTDKQMMTAIGECVKDLDRIQRDYTDGADLKYGVVNPLVITLSRALSIVQTFDVQEMEALL